MSLIKSIGNKKNLIIAGALTTVFLAGGAAVASGKDNGCGKGESHAWSTEHDSKRSERRVQRLAKKLELNGDQKTQVQEILQSSRERMQQQMQGNLDVLKTELAAVLSAEQLEKFESMRGRHHGKRSNGKKVVEE